jgi:branched-chain amino acid transport system substrate-binding protein
MARHAGPRHKEVIRMNRTLTTGSAAVAAAVLLAACGGGGGASSGGEEVESVKVGLLEPLSGPFADNGKQARLGAELCTKQINEAGGIKSLDGAKIELVVKDTGAAAPAQVANQLQSMIGQNDLSAIIGAWASSYTLAASTVAEQAKVPMVTESFADDIVKRNYKYIFKLPASATLMGAQAVDSVLELAKKQDYEITTAAVVADNTSAATVSANGAAARLTSLGVKVPVKEFFTPGLTEGNSLAIKVLAAKPQLIFVQGALSDMALLQRAFKEQGYTGPLLGAGSGFVATDYAKTVGEAANGTFSSAGWNWDMPGEEAKKFAAAFTKEHPEFPFPGQEAGEDCAAIHIIAAALEKAKSTEPQKVRDAISSIEITEGPATILASGKVAFDETGMLKDTTPVIIQWQNGKPVTVAPEKIAAGEPIPFSE